MLPGLFIYYEIFVPPVSIVVFLHVSLNFAKLVTSVNVTRPCSLKMVNCMGGSLSLCFLFLLSYIIHYF